MYEQPKNLGFICAAQLTHVKLVNNLFSAKPSDTEEVGVLFSHVLANGILNRALIVRLGSQSHDVFSNTKSFTEFLE